MRSKILSLFSVGILALIVCMAFVSAANTFTVNTDSVTFELGDNSKQITVTNTNDSVLLDLSLSTLVVGNIPFNVNGNTTGINTSSVLTITPVNGIDYTELDVREDLSGNLVLTDSNNPSEKENVTVAVSTTNYCDYENEDNDLEVKIDDIENLGIGDDENWYPLDKIKVEVEIENKGDDDIDDISIEWGVYSEKAEAWIIEPDEEDTIDLTDDDEDKISFEFELDDDLDVSLDDLENGDHYLYVRATGTVDKSGSPKTCAEDSEKADMIIEKHFVSLNNIQVVGSTFCGGTVQITADIWNLGSKEEEDFKIKVKNSELGIDEEIIIDDLNAFDDKDLNLEFSIPDGIEEKSYSVSLKIYDEDGDLYESEDTDAVFYVSLDVSGNCEMTPEAKVLASLESGGKAGEEMEIKATITNEGSESDTFTVSLGDYSEWADLISVDPESVTLDSAESQDITITLSVDADADDIETFNIILEGSDGGVLTQPIEVSINQGFSLSRMFNSGNGYVWGIAILNIILVLVIIIIAVKAARR